MSEIDLIATCAAASQAAITKLRDPAAGEKARTIIKGSGRANSIFKLIRKMVGGTDGKYR